MRPSSVPWVGTGGWPATGGEVGAGGAEAAQHPARDQTLVVGGASPHGVPDSPPCSPFLAGAVWAAGRLIQRVGSSSHGGTPKLRWWTDVCVTGFDFGARAALC